MRRAAVALALAVLARAAVAQDIVAADYADPTGRYDHAILGDGVEYGSLVITTADGATHVATLPADHVFEDLAPRLWDVDGDGDAEVVTVETDMALGAALAIYDTTGKLAETPHIGRTHRWLAPVGAADLDGDGRVEIAYVDRPHLARVLRVWRHADGALHPVAALEGLTNHRIGENVIAGGIRDCGAGPEMILADAGWRRVMAVRLTPTAFTARPLGAYRNAASLARALDCGM